MPLHLVPPGTRKGNPYYLVRGEVGGRSIEVSSKTTDEQTARKFALRLELELLENRVPEADEQITFNKAADLYIAWRDPSKADLKRIDKLRILAIGKKLITQITNDDLVAAANGAYPVGAPATKNREIMRPAATILHRASETGRCAYMKIKLFKEPRAKTRAVTIETAKVIVNSLPPLPAVHYQMGEQWLRDAEVRQRKKALLLLWLFRQGPRISDALKVEVANLNLPARTVMRRIGKTDEDDVIEALHDEVWDALANDPPVGRWLFPWRTKSGVYKWLRPYCKGLGIKFTPHMARHSLGKWLNEDGASLRTIMDTLHHSDPKSSIRYQSTDVEVVREKGRRLGSLKASK